MWCVDADRFIRLTLIAQNVSVSWQTTKINSLIPYWIMFFIESRYNITRCQVRYFIISSRQLKQNIYKKLVASSLASEIWNTTFTALLWNGKTKENEERNALRFSLIFKRIQKYSCHERSFSIWVKFLQNC